MMPDPLLVGPTVTMSVTVPAPLDAALRDEAVRQGYAHGRQYSAFARLVLLAGLRTVRAERLERQAADPSTSPTKRLGQK